MPDPNLEIPESQEFIIVGMGNPNSFASTYNFNLPDGSVAEIDSSTDTITTGK